jgi:hypothetical protein
MFAFVCSASIAQAGLIITLAPESYPPYPTIDPIRVEVFAQLDANGPPSVLVRGLQFNLSDSSPGLDVRGVLTYSSDYIPIYFWDFSSASACNVDPAACGGLNYFVDQDLDYDSNLVIAYEGLFQSQAWQMKLSQDAPTRIGLLDVAIQQFGVFDLDLLNADESNFFDNGGWFAFGFGVTDSDPAIQWSAHEGSITGGHLRFVIPDPGTLTLLCVGAMMLAGKQAADRKQA